MRLRPFVSVDDTAFSLTPAELLHPKGVPTRRVLNDVGLEHHR